MSFCMTRQAGNATKFRQLVFRLLLKPFLIGHTIHLPGLCRLGYCPTSCGWPLPSLRRYPHREQIQHCFDIFSKALNNSWLSLVERCECGDAQSASSPCSEMLDKLDSPLLTTLVSVQSTACFHRDSSSQSPSPLQLTDLLASVPEPFDERALTYLVQRKAGLQISCRWQPSPSLSLCCRGVKSLRYLGLLPCPAPQQTRLVPTSSPHSFTLCWTLGNYNFYLLKLYFLSYMEQDVLDYHLSYLSTLTASVLLSTSHV